MVLAVFACLGVGGAWIGVGVVWLVDELAVVTVVDWDADEL